LAHRFNWQRVHAIGALACAPDGSACELLLYVQEQPINKETILAYLPALRAPLGEAVVLLWDGLPSHRSKVVQEYLLVNRDWLWVERFPGYAPELNPQEYVWSALKGKDLANYCPETTLQIADQLQMAQERIGQDQEKLYGFLVGSTLYKKRTDRTLG
jgi:transposase